MSQLISGTSTVTQMIIKGLICLLFVDIGNNIMLQKWNNYKKCVIKIMRLTIMT